MGEMATNDQLIAQIWASPLLNGELGFRSEVLLADWLVMSTDQQSAWYAVGIAAIRQVDHRKWQHTVSQLQHTPHATAVLIALWQRCAVSTVRDAAGRALLAINNPETRDVLRRSLYSHEIMARSLALQILFSDDGGVWQNVSPLFRDTSPAGIIIGREALELLAPHSYPDEPEEWRVPHLRGEVIRDRRWLALCVELRRDSTWGSAARQALRYADPAVVGPELLAERGREKKQRDSRWTTMADPEANLLQRYECEPQAVWRSLQQAGELNETWRVQADLVAAATMHRVRLNAGALVDTLIAYGWPIDRSTALPGPHEDIDDVLAELADIAGGPIPPAVAAFYRIVGPIDLVSTDLDAAPSFMVELDPLQLRSPSDCWYSVEEWQEEAQDLDPELSGPLELAASADHLHKANISGGLPYAFWLPDHTADPVLREESHELAFTDYLRLTFRQKGFGLADGKSSVESREWLTGLNFQPEPF